MKTSSCQLLGLRKSHRINPPKLATAATAAKVPACRPWNALRPTAPPVVFALALASCVGINGSDWKDIAPVAPAVALAALKIENGSPVEAIPVGVAVILILSSWNPKSTQSDSNSTPKQLRRQWDRKGAKVSELNRHGCPQQVVRRCHIAELVLRGSSNRSREHRSLLACIHMKRRHCKPTMSTASRNEHGTPAIRIRTKEITYIESFYDGYALRFTLF